MSTSRGATPADPVLVATTDDNSRGGLFARSNIANPVQGVDVSGTTIGDGTITLQLNGDTVGSFTLNQSDSETFNFVVQGGGGVTANNYVTGGMLSTDMNTLILTREGLPDLSINVTPLNQSGSGGITLQEARTAADEQITASTVIVKSVNGESPTDSSGAITIPTGQVTDGSFADSDTVIFSMDSDNPALVTADARMLLGNGTAESTATNAATSLIVDPDTNYEIGLVGNGVYVFRQRPDNPQGNAGGSISGGMSGTALQLAPTPSGSFNADPGSMLQTVTGTITGRDGAVNVPATVTIDDARDMATITFPASTTDDGAGDYSAPGDYTVTTNAQVITSSNSDPRPVIETMTFNRFVPFFQSRSDITGNIGPTTDLDSLGITASDTGWTGSFTTIPTQQGVSRSTLYFAVSTEDLPATTRRVRVGGLFTTSLTRVRSITVTFADMTTQQFTVFSRASVDGGTELSMFS